MIKSLRKRTRPDNLVNQVRAGGKSTARRVYLFSVSGAVVFVAFQFFGPLLFLSSDGMVLRDTQVVAADYVGRIERVFVKPGDQVAAGTVIATLQSNDVVDKLSEMTGKVAVIAARQSQIEGRMRSLAILKPSALERLEKARSARARITDLANRQLTTSVRVSEAAREVFEAEKELTQIVAEAATLKDELEGIQRSRGEMEHLRATISASYNNGNVVTATGGTVSARVLVAGVVVKRGEALAEIYHGDSYVRAFVPRDRLYSVGSGERVIVTDGLTRRWGQIERLEAVSDQLPQEFQNSLKSVERQQLMRVRLTDSDAPFPIPSQVKVLGRFTPYAIFDLAKGTIAVADGPRSALSMMISGLGFGQGGPSLGDLDITAVGSLSNRRKPHSVFTLPPDEGPPDWRALTERAPAKHWKARD